MAVDVLNFPDLLDVERDMYEREMRDDLGAFYSGDDVSQKIGYGLEMDGLREYVPGDDARHIDWIRSAGQADGTLLWRKHYAEQSPLTVIVSDIPESALYKGTYGNPASARTLGYVAANIAARSASEQHSPVLALWSNGYQREQDASVYEGPNSAELALEDGFVAGRESDEYTDTATEMAKAENAGRLTRKKKLEKLGDVTLPERESLADLLAESTPIAQQFAEAARFIVISGFNYGNETASAIEMMEQMRTHNDVLAVQVTHPLMRGIPEYIDEINIGGGRVLEIESDAQRQAYGEKATARLEEVQTALRSAVTGFVELDTVDPRLSQISTQA